MPSLAAARFHDSMPRGERDRTVTDAEAFRPPIQSPELRLIEAGSLGGMCGCLISRNHPPLPVAKRLCTMASDAEEADVAAGQLRRNWRGIPARQAR